MISEKNSNKPQLSRVPSHPALPYVCKLTPPTLTFKARLSSLAQCPAITKFFDVLSQYVVNIIHSESYDRITRVVTNGEDRELLTFGLSREG